MHQIPLFVPVPSLQTLNNVFDLVLVHVATLILLRFLPAFLYRHGSVYRRAGDVQIFMDADAGGCTEEVDRSSHAYIP